MGLCCPDEDINLLRNDEKAKEKKRRKIERCKNIAKDRSKT